jgi:hypothetical protein
MTRLVRGREYPNTKNAIATGSAPWRQRMGEKIKAGEQSPKSPRQPFDCLGLCGIRRKARRRL